MIKVHVGDEITAVYMGKVDRYVRLIRAYRVGRKYLHGVTLSPDQEGLLVEGHPTKINIEESTIYHGLRHDLRAEEFKHRKDYRLWKQKRQEKQRDLERELRDLINRRLASWDLLNPMPERTEFPAPEEKKDG